MQGQDQAQARRGRRKKLTMTSVHLPMQVITELDELIRQGIAPSRSELIRRAVMDFIARARGGAVIESLITDPCKPMVIDVNGGDEDGGVTLRCVGCGYVMARFNTKAIRQLISTLKTHGARCPRCGGHKLVLEFTKTMAKHTGVVQA